MTDYKRKDWQLELETTPQKTYMDSVISIYDLLYDKDGVLYSVKAQTSKDVGARLAHDIICYNSETYDESAGLPYTEYDLKDTQCSWRIYGIDVAIPQYDLRANHKFIKNETQLEGLSIDNNYLGYTTNKYLFSLKKTVSENGTPTQKNGYYLFDKDAIVIYNTLEEFTSAGVQLDPTAQAITWNSYSAPSVCPIDDIQLHLDDPCDIILANEDLAFKGNLVTRSSFRAFNKLYLNTESSFFAKLICKALGFNKWVVDPEGVLNYRNTDEDGVWGRNFRANVLKLCEQDWFIEALKNTYVLVRSAFFADYIKTETFGQDLNKDSQVQHSELMLSTGTGDFNKYDDIFISKQLITPGMLSSTGNAEALDTSKLSEATETYIPQTNPIVDFLTSNFIEKNIGANSEDGNYSPKLPEGGEAALDDYLTKKVNIPTGKSIKGLPIAAINRKDAQNELDEDKKQNMVPENYFDDESRKTASDYYENGRMPTILPTKGNAYVEGRIIGPTVDEIWYAIDKLISGRLSDVYTIGENAETIHRYSDTKTLDIGLPIGSGDKVNDKDSTLTEVRDSEFNFKYNDKEQKVGTPLRHEYFYDTSDLTYDENTGKYKLPNGEEASLADLENRRKVRISKFINQNDEIVYPVYEALEQLADEILYLRNTDYVDAEIKESRQLDDFTAWEYPRSISGENEEPNINGTFTRRNKINNGQRVKYSENTNWGPRPAPYSLRELEAMVKAEKFNFETFARFVKETFSVTGRYGKVVPKTANDSSNATAGSLYQFHKDYNFNPKNPNTWFNRYGNNDTLTGTPAVFDDRDSRIPNSGIDMNFRNHSDYGTADNLREKQSEYGSADVYLAADGTWRFLFDHVRVPILRCEY